MKLTKEQIKYVATLANLPLTFEEEEKYSDQLSGVLDYINLLNKVKTFGEEPTFNVSGLANVLRADKATISLSQDESLLNSSAKKDGMFITKGVFEER